jgi:hypothetical protein
MKSKEPTGRCDEQSKNENQWRAERERDVAPREKTRAVVTS